MENDPIKIAERIRQLVHELYPLPKGVIETEALNSAADELLYDLGYVYPDKHVDLRDAFVNMFRAGRNLPEIPKSEEGVVNLEVKEEPCSLIIQNALKCLACGKIIASTSVHDYASCGCANKAMVDGGKEYIRCGWIDKELIQDLSVFEKDSFETMCDKLVWGSYGIKGDEPLKFNFIKDLEVDHINAILKNVKSISFYHKEVMTEILKRAGGKRETPCENCKEDTIECACMRNKCIKCGESVGNITFTVCDKCWGKEKK